MNNKYLLAASTALFFSVSEGMVVPETGGQNAPQEMQMTEVVNNPNMYRSQTEGNILPSLAKQKRIAGATNTANAAFWRQAAIIARTSDDFGVRTPYHGKPPISVLSKTKNLSYPIFFNLRRKSKAFFIKFPKDLYVVDFSTPSHFAHSIVKLCFQSKDCAIGRSIIAACPEYSDSVARYILKNRIFSDEKRFTLFVKLGLRYDDSISGKGWSAFLLNYGIQEVESVKLTPIESVINTMFGTDESKKICYFGTSDLRAIKRRLSAATPSRKANSQFMACTRAYNYAQSFLRKLTLPSNLAAAAAAAGDEAAATAAGDKE